MTHGEAASRLRALCERASKEYDHDKLLDLVRQINDLLEQEQKSPVEDRNRKPAGSGEEKKASPLLWGVVAVSLIAKSAEEWLELYPWIAPARG